MLFRSRTGARAGEEVAEGIASLASPLTLSPDMKELAIQAREGGPFVQRSLESVRDHF